MLDRYYTVEELQRTKFYELPNCVYRRILEDIKKVIGYLTQKIVDILNNSMVTELDQYCNIYKYIVII